MSDERDANSKLILLSTAMEIFKITGDELKKFVLPYIHVRMLEALQSELETQAN
jgi:hypothetical protein